MVGVLALATRPINVVPTGGGRTHSASLRASYCGAFVLYTSTLPPQVLPYEARSQTVMVLVDR